MLIVQLEDAVDEIGWILGVGLSARCLERGELSGFPVFLGELLYAEDD